MQGIDRAISLEGMIILGVIYFVFSLISRAGRAAKGAPQLDDDGETGIGSAQGEGPPGLSSTQREGFSLEKVLREIERVKAEAERREAQSRTTAPQRPKPAVPRTSPPASGQRGPKAWQSRPSPSGAGHGEARRWPGRSEENFPAEAVPDRPGRELVDQDDAAELVVQRRIVAAEARNREREAADHTTFDQRIRQEVADKTATTGISAKQLRDAFVWQEVLGLPVSLRDRTID